MIFTVRLYDPAHIMNNDNLSCLLLYFFREMFHSKVISLLSIWFLEVCYHMQNVYYLCLFSWLCTLLYSMNKNKNNNKPFMPNLWFTLQESFFSPHLIGHSWTFMGFDWKLTPCSQCLKMALRGFPIFEFSICWFMIQWPFCFLVYVIFLWHASIILFAWCFQ